MRCPDSAIFSLSTLANSERSGEPVIRASSATVPLTFGNLVNELLLRRSSRFISLVGKQNTRERPSRLRNQRLDDEPTSTKTAIAPLFIGAIYSPFMHSYPLFESSAKYCRRRDLSCLPYFAILCSLLYLNGLSEVSHITDSRSNVVRIAFFRLLIPPTLPLYGPVGMLHERLGAE